MHGSQPPPTIARCARVSQRLEDFALSYQSSLTLGCGTPEDRDALRAVVERALRHPGKFTEQLKRTLLEQIDSTALINEK